MIWSDRLLTGEPSIDAQHKEIFRRIDDLLAAGMRGEGKKKVEETLDFLGRYVVEHFSMEESLQSKSGYPNAAPHKYQHELFINSYKALQKAYNDEGATLNITLQVNKVVVDWLVEHINTHDMAFANYYAK